MEDGPAVLEALQVQDYDLLLLDCQMPGMDGDVVTEKVRQDPERYGGDPVIVAVTADTTEQHRDQCIAAGMDDFMPKPIRLEVFARAWRAGSRCRPRVAMLRTRQSWLYLRRGLVERTGHDDESFLKDYIGLFLEDTERDSSSMSQALASGEVRGG